MLLTLNILLYFSHYVLFSFSLLSPFNFVIFVMSSECFCQCVVVRFAFYLKNLNKKIKNLCVNIIWSAHLTSVQGRHFYRHKYTMRYFPEKQCIDTSYKNNPPQTSLMTHFICVVTSVSGETLPADALGWWLTNPWPTNETFCYLTIFLQNCLLHLVCLRTATHILHSMPLNKCASMFFCSVKHQLPLSSRKPGFDTDTNYIMHWQSTC